MSQPASQAQRAGAAATGQSSLLYQSATATVGGIRSANDLVAAVEKAFTASHSLTYQADCDVVLNRLGQQVSDSHCHVSAVWDSESGGCRVDVTQHEKVVRILALDNGSGYYYDPSANRYEPINFGDQEQSITLSGLTPAMVTVYGGAMLGSEQLGFTSQIIGDDAWRYAPDTDPHAEVVTICDGPNTDKDNPRVAIGDDGKMCCLPIMSEVVTVDRKTLVVKSIIEDYTVLDVTTPTRPSVLFSFRETQKFTNWQLDAKADPSEFAWKLPVGSKLDPKLDTQNQIWIPSVR